MVRRSPVAVPRRCRRSARCRPAQRARGVPGRRPCARRYAADQADVSRARHHQLQAWSWPSRRSPTLNIEQSLRTMQIAQIIRRGGTAGLDITISAAWSRRSSIQSDYSRPRPRGAARKTTRSGPTRPSTISRARSSAEVDEAGRRRDRRAEQAEAILRIGSRRFLPIAYEKIYDACAQPGAAARTHVHVLRHLRRRPAGTRYRVAS